MNLRLRAPLTAIAVLATSLTGLGTAAVLAPAGATPRGVDDWVYYGRTTDLTTQVWRARPGDAASATQLTTADNGAAPFAVSPDGREVLYRRGGGELWRMDSDGSDPVAVPTPGLTVTRASYTPDGRRLLLVASSGSTVNVWTAGRSGANLRPVFAWEVASQLQPGNASWSPDGTRILFTGISTRTSDREVMTAAPDGTARRTLTANAGADVRPDWSPDGRTIVWLTTVGGAAKPFAMDADGTDQRSASSVQGQVDDLSFTPDGHLLLKVAVNGVGSEVRRTTVGGDAGQVVVPASQDVSITEPRIGAQPTQCGGRWATIVGTAGADVLRGSTGNDVIVAGAGNDTVEALGGDDVVCGGAGNDVITGGLGADRLFGQSGSDTLRAKDGVKDARIDCGADKDAAAVRDKIDPAAVSC